MRWKPILFATGLLAAASSAVGGLKWDSQVAELKLQRGVDVDGRTHFDCLNTGTKPVTILGISTTCGCTTATPEAETIPPGGRDRIWVVFELGRQHGSFMKKIGLKTDDTDAREAVLTLKVSIADEVAPAPKHPGN